MQIPAEFQLAAVILVIYLLDCLALLYVNEGIVEQRRGRWHIGFGSSQPWIAGKRIALLNPLTPQVPAWRAAWHIRESLDGCGTTHAVGERLDQQARALRKLRAGQWVAWVLVLVVLPIALCIRNTLGFVAVAMVAWSAVWVLIIRVWFLRRVIGLSAGAFALIAFECLVCPPNAANLVRKLSMRKTPDTDLVAISGLLPVDARRKVFEHIDNSVAARQVLLDPGTPEYARSERYRNTLGVASTPDPKDENIEESSP